MSNLLGVGQAAQRLGCHVDTVKRRISRGELPAVKVAGRWRVNVQDLERMIERPARTPDDDRRAIRAKSR